MFIYIFVSLICDLHFVLNPDPGMVGYVLSHIHYPIVYISKNEVFISLIDSLVDLHCVF